MVMDFLPFYRKYEQVVRLAEDAFEKVRADNVSLVKCKPGCSDCCHALFDLSLVEALYINHHFNQRFQGAEREALLEKANRADRIVYKLKREAFQEIQQGKNEVEILGEMAAARVRCPLLNDDQKCDLYEYRPITCRLYGIPVSSQGMSHTCGLSGFAEGGSYQTVKIEAIQRLLYQISVELVQSLTTKYIQMADMLVPLSMALLTTYDEVYLGIKEKEEEKSGGKP